MSRITAILVALLVLAVALTAGCTGISGGSEVDAAVVELRAALDAQNLALENTEDVDIEFKDRTFVVTVGVPTRIEYASEKFAESAEHAAMARQHLESAIKTAADKDEVMEYGQYYEAALIIEDVAAYGLTLTAELRQPAPNGTACMVYGGVMDRLLDDQARALQRAGLR